MHADASREREQCCFQRERERLLCSGHPRFPALSFLSFPGPHLGQFPSDRAGLLWAEVEGEELLVLVELAQVLTLLLVDDGQDTGDATADAGAVGGNRKDGKVSFWSVKGCVWVLCDRCDVIAESDRCIHVAAERIWNGVGGGGAGPGKKQERHSRYGSHA